MIALTNITPAMYKALLEDAEHPFIDLQEKYGAGLALRMSGIITAFAVHDFNGELEYKNAQLLYNEIKEADYVKAIFEENGFRAPGDALLDAMTFSMCQAETGDYEDEEDDDEPWDY